MDQSHVISRVTPLVAVLGLILFGFQNCGVTPDGIQLHASEDGEVRIIDRWDTSKVSFFSPVHLIQDNVDSGNIYGLCANSEQGSVLFWQILDLDESAAVVASGSSICDNGSFVLSVVDLEFQSCDDQLQVRARLESDINAIATTELRPHCSL